MGHRLSNHQLNTNEALGLEKKLYSSTERELVFDWSEKWIELISLINEVTGVDEPPWLPPPPTDIDELQY